MSVWKIHAMRIRISCARCGVSVWKPSRLLGVYDFSAGLVSSWLLSFIIHLYSVHTLSSRSKRSQLETGPGSWHSHAQTTSQSKKATGRDPLEPGPIAVPLLERFAVGEQSQPGGERGVPGRKGAYGVPACGVV